MDHKPRLEQNKALVHVTKTGKCLT